MISRRKINPLLFGQGDSETWHEGYLSTLASTEDPQFSLLQIFLVPHREVLFDVRQTSTKTMTDDVKVQIQ